jgi:hypothetical protein
VIFIVAEKRWQAEALARKENLKDGAWAYVSHRDVLSGYRGSQNKLWLTGSWRKRGASELELIMTLARLQEFSSPEIKE